jgi:cytochrome c oxidase subunit III
MTEGKAHSMENTETVAAKHRIDYMGAKMGMWIFLFTEVLFFGGLFLVYSVYRAKYPGEFHNAAAELDLWRGATNTVLLLTSSMTMALSIALLKKGKKPYSLLCQGMTVLLGALFLASKYLEWGVHITRGIYPDSPLLIEMSRGKIVFFGLYYVMTGLHGLHVLIGIAVISGIFILTMQETINPHDFVKMENAGLYWHVVDIIWIYLFPLFYLIT